MFISKLIICLCFHSIKGANDAAERSFSMVKKLWTNDRSELTIMKIRSLALIKFNCNQTCLDFFASIQSEPDVLRAIKSGDKYKENKIRMTFRALQLNTNELNDSEDCC